MHGGGRGGAMYAGGMHHGGYHGGYGHRGCYYGGGYGGGYYGYCGPIPNVLVFCAPLPFWPVNPRLSCVDPCRRMALGTCAIWHTLLAK